MFEVTHSITDRCMIEDEAIITTTYQQILQFSYKDSLCGQYWLQTNLARTKQRQSEGKKYGVFQFLGCVKSNKGVLLKMEV